ncbi:NeuD/PglB/VioB family sugar acetyltransferase [Clostridium culturomicium]|uniref:NeuD/PglB/VioB family sugar acetyltransferase n=1 Tax=Clostridium culturomicium TaxID=1499683 RepID=UPI00058CBE31|nr:NeuD/PglB/VioB family sugar acetyltransferase [Clostridium culturomicium]
MTDIVIIGAGGIGREAAWIIEEINKVNEQWNLLGFVDDNSEMWGKELNGYKVLGDINTLLSLKNKPYVIVAMANCKEKKRIVEKLKGNFEFVTLIHPSVRISGYIKVGQGTIIYPGTILTVNTTIGKHVLISGNCGIGHDTVIGDYSSILWGCNLSGYDTLGEGCFIGIGTSIAQGISIEDGYKAMTGSNIIESIVAMEVGQ